MSDNYKVLFISHHGILGQKHGRRRYQNPDGSLTPLGRLRYGKGGPKKSVTKSGKLVKTTSKDETSKPRKKSLSEMNDEELQKQVNRFKLEKEYKSLLKEVNPPKEKKVRKLISEIAETSIKNIGTQTVTYAMGTAINKVCKSVFGIDEDIVNPKKGQKDK